MCIRDRITDLAKRGGDAGGIADPAMRERMWATMQAKQALRAALQNTPEAVGDAELDERSGAEDSDEGSPEEDSDEGSAEEDSAAGDGGKSASLKARWRDSAEPSAGSSSGSGVPSGSGAAPAEGKKASHHKPAADPNARTTTTSSMRRHRAGKKAKEAKAAKLAAFNE